MTIEELKEKVKNPPICFFNPNSVQKMLRELPDGCLLRIRGKKTGRHTYGVHVKTWRINSALRIQSPYSPVEHMWMEYADLDHYYSLQDIGVYYYQDFDISRIA